ncbi:unnamed protein product [[Candida] boidinii]|uniref:Unnamed protein product n=1 Tax=Candida boidinii TaxID=5477 RepID=A0ACB5TN47_CANBO|nr:unnamed protein product [[Candida] boidinii]
MNKPIRQINANAVGNLCKKMAIIIRNDDDEEEEELVSLSPEPKNDEANAIPSVIECIIKPTVLVLWKTVLIICEIGLLSLEPEKLVKGLTNPILELELGLKVDSSSS